MPLYNNTTAGPVLALYPGETVTLIAATDSLTAPAAGKQINLPSSPGGGQAQVIFSTHFAVAPTAVVTIQSAVADADANYIATSSTSTNKQDDQLSVATSAPFLRPQITSQSAGGALTVTAYRAA